MIYCLISILIGYGFGSFLTACFVAKKYTGKDISEIGTGNPGMANVMARVGKVPGLLVLLGDVLKTALAMGLCSFFFSEFIGDQAALFAGFGALLGHNFPLWRKLKGGKGVAVTCAWIILYMPFGGISAAVAGGIITVLTGLLPLGAVIITLFEIPFAFLEKGPLAGGVMIASFLIMLYRNFPGFIRGFKNEESREFNRSRSVKNTVGTILTILLVVTLFFLDAWMMKCKSETYYEPKVQQKDISSYYDVTSMDELEEEDFDTIFAQTGVAKAGVESLIDVNKMYLLETMQQHFFTRPEITERTVQLVRHQERVSDSKDTTSVFILEEGDIIVTLSNYIGGWRYGHAGIVLDAAKGEILEALTYGEPSEICSISHWTEYPAYVVLRAKNLTEEEREGVADYARENLMGLEYGLLANKKQENITNTHCALIIWQAFQTVGLDLDSDGGYFVTPQDIIRSDCLEMVMEYGMNY
ncbi:MAG: glycerol-3-phosphate acyltransferase [Lachnospiraceae bacterium]|nr:glycerol-3-phosphate acyltransferase [Lachnospiraceae bacterium]